MHMARYFTTPLADGARVTAPSPPVPGGGLRLRRQLPAEGRQGAGSPRRSAPAMPMPLLDTVIQINLKQPQRVIEILGGAFRPCAASG